MLDMTAKSKRKRSIEKAMRNSLARVFETHGREAAEEAKRYELEVATGADGGVKILADATRAHVEEWACLRNTVHEVPPDLLKELAALDPYTRAVCFSAACCNLGFYEHGPRTATKFVERILTDAKKHGSNVVLGPMKYMHPARYTPLHKLCAALDPWESRAFRIHPCTHVHNQLKA